MKKLPNVWIDLNSLVDLEDRIKEKIYDDFDLDNVNIDLSKFDLKIDYVIDVKVSKITLENKTE